MIQIHNAFYIDNEKTLGLIKIAYNCYYPFINISYPSSCWIIPWDTDANTGLLQKFWGLFSKNKIKYSIIPAKLVFYRKFAICDDAISILVEQQILTPITESITINYYANKLKTQFMTQPFSMNALNNASSSSSSLLNTPNLISVSSSSSLLNATNSTSASSSSSSLMAPKSLWEDDDAWKDLQSNRGSSLAVLQGEPTAPEINNYSSSIWGYSPEEWQKIINPSSNTDNSTHNVMGDDNAASNHFSLSSFPSNPLNASLNSSSVTFFSPTVSNSFSFNVPNLTNASSSANNNAPTVTYCNSIAGNNFTLSSSSLALFPPTFSNPSSPKDPNLTNASSSALFEKKSKRGKPSKSKSNTSKNMQIILPSYYFVTGNKLSEEQIERIQQGTIAPDNTEQLFVDNKKVFIKGDFMRINRSNPHVDITNGFMLSQEEKELFFKNQKNKPKIGQIIIIFNNKALTFRDFLPYIDFQLSKSKYILSVEDRKNLQVDKDSNDLFFNGERIEIIPKTFANVNYVDQAYNKRVKKRKI